MPVTLEEAMRDFLIELAYLDLMDIYERIHALYPDTFRELSDEELRYIATLYVDLMLGFSGLELDADGYAPFLALDEDALRALLELNGSPYVEGHGHVTNAISQMDLVIPILLNEIINAKDDQGRYIHCEQTREAARRNLSRPHISLEVIDIILRRALFPNSTLTDATLSGAILIIIAGGYAAPYLISRISGFIVAAGTPAAIAARDFISFLLKKGQPLLYNENLQPYIQTLLHAAAASIVITRREDGSYAVYFDGETFIILASMGTLFLAVSEMHKYLAWAKKKATGTGAGSGAGSPRPADGVAKGAGNLKPKHLMDELANSGVKYTPNDVIMVTKTSCGKLLWLEKGSNSAGLKHIVNGHAADFAAKGVTDIPSFLQQALQGTPINSGVGAKGPYMDFFVNGSTYRVVHGTNGFIVSFYPINN